MHHADKSCPMLRGSTVIVVNDEHTPASYIRSIFGRFAYCYMLENSLGHWRSARLAQLVRSLTTNQKVPGLIPGLVEGWTLGDLLSPHRPWTGTLSRWSSRSPDVLLGDFLKKITRIFVDKSRLMPVLWIVNGGLNLMFQNKKHFKLPISVWLRLSTTEPCIFCKKVAKKSRREHLKLNVWMYGCG